MVSADMTLKNLRPSMRIMPTVFLANRLLAVEIQF